MVILTASIFMQERVNEKINSFKRTAKDIHVLAIDAYHTSSIDEYSSILHEYESGNLCFYLYCTVFYCSIVSEFF